MRIAVDATKQLAEEPGSGHNRWHPDIEPLARIGQDKEITLETRDGIDGQLGPTSTHADASVDALDLGLGHPMTGPVYVEGASPGDVLEVEFVSFEAADFGVAAIIPGFGFLADLFEEPFVAKFELRDGFARSEELPGVAVPADIFPGVVGVAPSHELMEVWRTRESELAARGGAVADDLPDAAIPSLAASGARTIPPRELGGNMDVRGLVAGSRAYFPVEVPGALFSIGDLHFAQGDGETCGTGIEMAGAATVRFRVHKNPTWRPRFPAYETPPQRPRRTFATTGISLDDDGRNEDMNLQLATRRAIVEMIEWAGAEQGLSREAAYVLVSIAVDLRLSEIVDVPNPVVSAVVPLDIFEQPSREEIVRARRRTEIQGALATEHRRGAALETRVEQAVRNVTGWRTDDEVATRLDATTVETLRDMRALLPEPGDDARERMERKVAELEEELATCRQRADALGAYLNALDALK
ncbi:MAG: acetamidase/formamidase family protein [Gaiellaceae bacterium]